MAWMCPCLPHGIYHCTNILNDPNPTNDGIPALPPPAPPRPLDCPWSSHRPACGIDTLLVIHSKCPSLQCPPHWGTGLLCQRCHPGLCDALVSSPAAGGRPSFASWGPRCQMWVKLVVGGNCGVCFVVCVWRVVVVSSFRLGWHGWVVSVG